MLFPWYIKYPNQNDEILNLDWILSTIDNLVNEVANFVSLNTIKYADPIQWNITTQYEKNTVVIDPITGSAYISTKPVPSGVGLNNTDYWNVIFTLDVISANKNITLRDDANNILATFESEADDWLLWQGTLYIVTRAIEIGQSYVVGYNIDRYTVERFLKEYITNLRNYVDTIIGDLADLNTSDKTDVVAAINSLLSDISNIIGDLDDLNTSDKTDIVAAINSLLSDISNIIGDLDDLDTSVKSNIVAAINSLLSDVNNTIGDLDDLDTSVKSNIVAAINEVVTNIGTLTDLKTSNKTNVVAAINEVNDIKKRTEDITNIALLGLDLTSDISSDIENLISNNHKRLYFPAGTYKFSITINTNYVEIFGDGFRTIFNPTTDACIKFDCRNGVDVGDAYLHDFRIEGTGFSRNGIETVGEFDTDPFNHSVFENIFIHGCSYGIKWRSRGIWHIFRNVWCYGNYYGIWVETPDAAAFNHNSFYDCVFGYNQANAIILKSNYDYKVNSITFYHCNIEANFNAGVPTGDYDVILINANGISFKDCYIEGNKGTATFMVSNSDCLISGGCSLVPTAPLLTSQYNAQMIVEGLKGYNASTQPVYSGSNNSRVCIIGSFKLGYTIPTGVVNLF